MKKLVPLILSLGACSGFSEADRLLQEIQSLCPPQQECRVDFNNDHSTDLVVLPNREIMVSVDHWGYFKRGTVLDKYEDRSYMESEDSGGRCPRVTYIPRDSLTLAHSK